MTSTIERETRRYKFGRVVVTPENIRAIARIIQDSVQSLTSDTARLSFKMAASDGSEYDSSSIDILVDGGILSTKTIRTISMNFNSYQGPRISFNIEHGNGLWHGNQIEVSGGDTVWVNGVMRQLEEAIRGWEAQPSWPKRFSFPMTIIFALGIGRLYLFLVNIVLNYVFYVYPIQPINPRPAWADILIPIVPLIQWVLALGTGIFPSMWLTDKIKRLWPNVEIRTGPEYAQINRRRRQTIGLIMTVGVLPFLLSVLSDLFRLFFGR